MARERDRLCASIFLPPVNNVSAVEQSHSEFLGTASLERDDCQ